MSTFTASPEAVQVVFSIVFIAIMLAVFLGACAPTAILLGAKSLSCVDAGSRVGPNRVGPIGDWDSTASGRPEVLTQRGLHTEHRR